MIFLLTGDYSEDDSLAMLRYFGPGQGPEYCGGFLDEDGFNGMLKFSGDKVGDFIYVQPGVMACNPKVKGFLESDAADDIQFIPINVGGMDLFIINVTRVIDVIDHSGTTAKFLPDGRLMKLDPCVIDEERVPDCLFFKIPENSCKALYGTERLKILVEESGFKGLRFLDLPRTI